MSLHIRNPHSVLAALETRPKDVLQIISPPGALEREQDPSGKDAWAKVLSVARSKGVQIVAGAGGPRESHHSKGPQKGGRPQQQGRPQPQDGGRVSVAEAVIRERQGLTAEELFE